MLAQSSTKLVEDLKPACESGVGQLVAEMHAMHLAGRILLYSALKMHRPGGFLPYERQESAGQVSGGYTMTKSYQEPTYGWLAVSQQANKKPPGKQQISSTAIEHPTH